jgi:hypothetical protein
MGHMPTRRRGLLWSDANRLNKIIREFPFNTTGKTEREFETGFSTAIIANHSAFNHSVISQIDKSKTVESVFCFGKKHRPDLTIGSDGIAIEIKLVTYDGLKQAIGQAYIYRLKYRFVFLILVMSEARKQVYESFALGKERDLEDILTQLAERNNIFTYIVPAFNITKPGVRKCIAYFK